MAFYEALCSLVGETNVHTNHPLARYTSFKIGGAGEYFISATNAEMVAKVFRLTKESNIPLTLLGRGSNILIKDGGVEGVVLHIGSDFSGITLSNSSIVADAGAFLPRVAQFALEHSLTGFEFAQGIPGSIGGAVMMNAGAYGSEMKNITQWVEVLHDNQIVRIPREALGFSYRHSAMMEKDCIILRACFKLENGSQSVIRETMNNLKMLRRTKQPLNFPSAGSFFKRPEGHYAAQLIDEAGLKGFTVGKACVSELHAGFVVNLGGATAHEVLRLMHHVQETVLAKFGVALEPEVRIIGKE